MEVRKCRTIVFYKNYFEEFFSPLSAKAKEKIDWTLKLIASLERVPESYLKHIEGTEGLYEIRAQQGNDIFRIFCFFDEGRLIVLANGFQKKTQKISRLEIKKALIIKKAYEQEKK